MRVTVTLPEALLNALEAEAGSVGHDRLAVIRDALTDHLIKKGRLPKSASSAGGEKKRPAPAPKAKAKAKVKPSPKAKPAAKRGKKK